MDNRLCLTHFSPQFLACYYGCYIFLESCMLHQIEKWIDQTNIEYQDKRISCSKFFDEFKGFYSLEFLQQSYFVIVDAIPKPVVA